MATSDFSVKGNLVINGIVIESDGVNINFPATVTFDNQTIASFVEDSTPGIDLTDLSASGDLVYNNVTGVFSVTTYKSADFDADFANKTTTNLAEGTNFYFTTARARAAVSANTGLSYNASTGVFTNSAPDQTVVLTAGTGITTSGTYPNFTVTNSAPDQTVVLTEGSNITITGTYPNFTISSSGGSAATITSANFDSTTGVLSLIKDDTTSVTTVLDGRYLTDYTVTQGDVTQHQSALSITESQISDLQNYLTTETNDLTSSVTWANVPDANITQSSVTQHQAALLITESQISDLQNYLTDYTVTESDVTQHQAALLITESQISDLQNYLTDYTVTESDVTQHQAALLITESQISDLGAYITDAPNDGESYVRNNQSWVTLDVDPTKATLTKSFAANEIASITLSEAIVTAPSVNVIKELPQAGQLSKERWDIASDGANYDRHDTAPNTTLNITQDSEITVEGASFDNVSLDFSQVSINFFTPYKGVAFDDTGDNLFVLDSNFNFEQYSLSSPYAINTASFVSDYNPNFDNNFTEPTDGLVFNNDGTSLFSVDNFSLAIRRYNLSTAYDLSTNEGQAAQSFSISTESLDLKFNDTGTKLYLAESANPSRIGQFSLSTAFDLTTVTEDFVTFGAPSNPDEEIRAFQFDSTGEKIFILYWNSNDVITTIREATLSTPYDLSTAAFNSKEFVDSGQAFDNPFDIVFDDSFSKLFVLGNDINTGDPVVFQYSTGTDQTNLLSLGTGSFAATDVGKQIEGNSGVVVLTDDDGAFSIIEPFADTSTIPAGEWGMFATTFDPSLGVTLTGISEAASIANASFDDIDLLYNNDVFDSVQSFIFNDTGTKLYFRTRFDLFQYNLSQPYDLTTAVFDFGFNVSTPFSDFTHSVMTWNADGTKFYITSGGTIRQFSVPSAYNLSGVNFNSEESSASSNVGNIVFIQFSADGTKIILSSVSQINEFALDTPFDISSLNNGFGPNAVFNFNFDVYGAAFNLEGDRLFVFAQDSISQEWSIRELSLSAPFSVSTISDTGNSYRDNRISSLDFSSAPRGRISLEAGDEKLFVLEDSFEFKLFQYTANIFSSIQPTGEYHPIVTNLGGQIDTTTWLNIFSMTEDEELGDGEVVYAVSTNGRTSWKVIDDTNGERIIARLNAGVWEINSAPNYNNESFVAATINEELYALQETLEATAVNRMSSTQLEAVTDPNHYVLGDTLDLMIALKIESSTSNLPSSDGIVIGYDAETLNKGAIHGVDYDYDFPNSTTVRFESLIAANLKIRIL